MRTPNPLQSSVDAEQVAYATLDGIDPLRGSHGEGVPPGAQEFAQRAGAGGLERDRLIPEPIVQIFDAEHPGRTRIVPELPIDASTGCPAEH